MTYRVVRQIGCDRERCREVFPVRLGERVTEARDRSRREGWTGETFDRHREDYCPAHRPPHTRIVAP